MKELLKKINAARAKIMRFTGKTINLAILLGAIWFSYQHGFYVGKLDAEANSNALQSAGYDIPFHVDSNNYALIK